MVDGTLLMVDSAQTHQSRRSIRAIPFSSQSLTMLH
jgi:hypothetical protein